MTREFTMNRYDVVYDLRYRVYGQDYDGDLDFDYEIGSLRVFSENGYKVGHKHLKEEAHKLAQLDACSYIREHHD